MEKNATLLDTSFLISEYDKCNIILYNDDITPLEFVIEMLSTFLNKTEEEAEELAINAHFNDKALCGEYKKSIAINLVNKIKQEASRHNYPLLLRII